MNLSFVDFLFKKQYSLNDLKDKEVFLDIDKKKQIQIAVIDDKPFDYASNLKKRGYHLVFKESEIESLDELSHYPVIVCDIHGVASNLYPIGQGLQLCKEIRKKYFNTYIILYSSSAIPIDSADYALVVDKVIPKNASLDSWDETLNQGVETVCSPSKTWVRVRNWLSKKEISTEQIMEFENKYIKTIIAKNSESKNMDLLTSIKIINIALEGAGLIEKLI